MVRVEGRSEAAWAYDFAASASASELIKASSMAGSVSTRRLFGALSWSYRGQSARCAAELEYALENCENGEMRAVYADFVSGYLMYCDRAGFGESIRAERAIEAMRGQGRDAEMTSHILGLHYRHASRERFDEMLVTAKMEATRAEPVARARVLQRLATYLSYVSRPNDARALALESLEISRRLRLSRTWSTSLKVLGELEAVSFNDVVGLQYMLNAEEVATQFGDDSYAHAICGHVFNLAVSAGDDSLAQRALTTFESAPSVDDHFERRMIWLSRCLLAGWSDVDGMGEALLADAGFDFGHCWMYGLLAVASACKGDRIAVDRYVRMSLETLDSASAALYGKKSRVKARLLIAAAHHLVGREALAARQLLTSDVRRCVGRHTLRTMLSGRVHELPMWLRGVGQVVISCVRRMGSSTKRLPRGLTVAEFEVLKAVNEGATLREIAATRRVSIDTVKHQCSSINRKFETTRTAKAAAEARRFGWL